MMVSLNGDVRRYPAFINYYNTAHDLKKYMAIPPFLLVLDLNNREVIANREIRHMTPKVVVT